MGRRSERKRCLLCVGYCSTVVGEREDPQNLPEQQQHQVLIKREPGEGLNMSGAVNCQRLQQQLENIFILRRVLDVPEHWCEETLMREGLEGMDCGNPSTWFTVCDQCKETTVTEAWKIYQQILALELQMLKIKEKVKGKMKEELLKPQNNSCIWQKQYHVLGRVNGVEGEIRSFIFPELRIGEPDDDKVEIFDTVSAELELDNDTLRSDDEWLAEGMIMSPASSSVSSDPLWEDGKINYNLSPFKQKIVRKRGRPPKNSSNGCASSKTNAFKIKRRRGRLPKTGFTSKQIRGPGRPRKNNNIADPHVRLDEYGNVKPKKWNWHCCHESQCRAKYTSSEELEAHKSAHEEQKALKDGEKRELDCPHCPFPAMNTDELELHIVKRHEDNRIFHYSCPKCDFTVQNDYPCFKLHFDENHPPVPEEMISNGDYNSASSASSDLPVTCPLCSKRCENLRYFTVHQRKMHPEHLGIQVESMECSQCGMKFATQLELQSHINGEHKRSSKFVCDQCGRGFQFMSRLESHKVTHTNKWKRDYVCHLCGLDYAYKDILNKHYAQCHPDYTKGEGGNNNEPSTAGAAATKVEDPTSFSSAPSGGREFKCRYCDFACSIRGILKRHLQHHKEEMGFKCEQCGKCYVNEPGLKRHLKINHPLVKESVPCTYCMKPFISVEYMRDHINKFCKMKKLEDQGQQGQLAATAPSYSCSVEVETIKRAPASDIFSGLDS